MPQGPALQVSVGVSWSGPGSAPVTSPRGASGRPAGRSGHRDPQPEPEPGSPRTDTGLRAVRLDPRRAGGGSGRSACRRELFPGGSLLPQSFPSFDSAPRVAPCGLTPPPALLNSYSFWTVSTYPHTSPCPAPSPRWPYTSPFTFRLILYPFLRSTPPLLAPVSYAPLTSCVSTSPAPFFPVRPGVHLRCCLPL